MIILRMYVKKGLQNAPVFLKLNYLDKVRISSYNLTKN